MMKTNVEMMYMKDNENDITRLEKNIDGVHESRIIFSKDEEVVERIEAFWFFTGLVVVGKMAAFGRRGDTRRMSYYQKIRRHSGNASLAATESARRTSTLLIDPLKNQGDRKMYVHELNGSRSRSNSYKKVDFGGFEDYKVDDKPAIDVNIDYMYEKQLSSLKEALKGIDRHQLPHQYATEGQILMHMARIEGVKQSKHEESWPSHTLPTCTNTNSVWNQQKHKSDYTFTHVKHPKPALLKKNLARRRKSMDFLKTKLSGNTEFDDRQRYVSIVREQLNAQH